VGHRCIGAKVNGKLVALQYELDNGNTVEIMTSKTVPGPSLDWLNPDLGYVKTGSAREKVRQWFNRQTRRANIESGREIAHKQLRRLYPELDDLEVARTLSFKTADELFAALGSGSISTAQGVSKLSSEEPETQKTAEAPLPSVVPGAGVEVLGVGDLYTRMARCCTPIHGDEIAGYITRNRGVTVHCGSCPNILNESEVERLVDVRWGKSEATSPVRIRIEAWDRVGLLRDVTALVSEERVNIASCVSEEYDDKSIISLTVFVNGIDQLSRLFAKLESIEGVMRLARASS
jgi:GTP pyrophosphokinase